MFTLPTEPQGIGKVIDAGFRLCFAGFKSVLSLSILVGILLGLQIIAQPSPNEQLEQLQQQMAGFFVLFVVLSLVTYVIFNGIIAKYGAIAEGETLGFGRALGVGLRKIIYVIFFLILYGILVVLGSVLLIIPGILLMVSLMFGWYAIVLEDYGPFKAIARSHKLVWGNCWRTLLYLTVILFIVVVIYLAISLPFTFIAGYMISSLEDLWLFNLVFAFGYTLATILVMPLTKALFVTYYKDLVLRKEGSDLKVRIATASG